MPQRLEKYLSFGLVCSKLQWLFLNANMKINDLFYPTVCGLKSFLVILTGVNFYGF